MLPPGPLLASGRTADVFAYRAGLVLRRYRRPGPTEFEAAVMEHARAAGFPAPRVHEVTETDMIMDRVEGRSMLEDLAARPWMLLAHAALLAELHQRLHAVAAPPWLSRSLGEGDSLLHLDLHPHNVLLARSGPMVIDWANAARGPGAVDVALTWLIGATSLPAGPGLDRRAARLGQSWFVGAFLRRFDRTELERALPVAGRFRLADHSLSGEERRAVEAWLARSS